MEPDADFAATVREHYARLVRVVAVASSTADAEDTVQEAFARAWEQHAKGREIHDLPAWVVTVALNLTRSRWRRRRPTEPLPPGALGGDGVDATDAEGLLDLRAAVAALPLRQAQCVVLHHLLGFDVRTIAAVLGVSDGTVKSALFRARTSLADALTEEVDDGRTAR